MRRVVGAANPIPFKATLAALHAVAVVVDACSGVVAVVVAAAEKRRGKARSLSQAS